MEEKNEYTEEEVRKLENEYALEYDSGEPVPEDDPEKEEEEKEKKKHEQPMGDIYDVYGKAVAVHSKLTSMTEDYTLTRYNVDIYNQKVPKFIREQRKVLRVIKSYIVIPLAQLLDFYNTKEKAKLVYRGLWKQYRMIEELLLGELDETVIMGRTDQGQVIEAFLEHGMHPSSREEYESRVDIPDGKSRLMEENRK